MKGFTIETKVHFHRGRRSKKELRLGQKREPVPAGRIPRLSRLMALAIRSDQLIRDGVVADQAELARLGHVSRARVTQILNLLNLSPDIQETLLFLPHVESGRDSVTERELRPIVAVPDWRKQRKMWDRLQVTTSVRNETGTRMHDATDALCNSHPTPQRPV